MSGAAQALQAAAIEALQSVEALGTVSAGAPLQSAFPHAIVECGAESDFSHKSGRGRELRLAVTVRTAGEDPGRAQALAEAADAALSGLAPTGWAIASFAFLRARTVAEPRGGERGWALVSDYRVRLLAAEA